MRHHRWISLLALGAMMAGCAGPSATVSSSSATGEEGSALPTTTALPSPRDFAGTWHGSYRALPAMGNSYDDEADCALRIKDDATYTVTCGRAKIGANDLARGSSWSGRVVTKGHEIVLHDQGGLWPTIVLRQSADGALFGTTLDPLVGPTIEIEFARESHPSASPSGQ